MAQWEKGFVAQPDNLSSVPGPIEYKFRTYFQLSSDFFMYVSVHTNAIAKVICVINLRASKLKSHCVYKSWFFENTTYTYLHR